MVFEKKQTEANIKKYKLKTVAYPVRVVSGKYDAKKDIAIFFVHGAPVASDNYYDYLQDSLLLSKANLICCHLDRSGEI